MYQNSFATVLEALAATRYRIQIANGTVLESTYYGNETFTVADRVFVEYLGASQLWMISSGVISAPAAPQTLSVSLDGTLSFGGAIASSRILGVGLSASLSFAGDIATSKTRNIRLDSALSFAGTEDFMPPPDFNYWNPDALPASPGADDDEFADASGGLPSGWTEFDPDAVQTVDESEQGLTLRQASIAGDNVTGIYKSIPAGNFTIATKVGLNALNASSRAGIALWEDATGNNGIYALDIVYTTGAMSIIVRRWTNRTTFNSNVVAFTDVLSVTGCYLRIRRTSTTYAFDFSTDGLGWMEIASTTLAFTPTHYGLAINDNGSGGDVMGRFGFFRYVASDLGNTGLLSGDRINGWRT